jgi:hypothetical protein
VDEGRHSVLNIYTLYAVIQALVITRSLMGAAPRTTCTTTPGKGGLTFNQCGRAVVRIFRGELVCRYGFAKEISLQLVTTEKPYRRRMLFGFDALGRNRQREGVREQAVA